MLIKFMASKETLPEASHCLQYLPLFVICWESSPWKPTMMSSKYFITTPSHWITTSSSVLRIHPSHHSTAHHMFYRHKYQLFLHHLNVLPLTHKPLPFTKMSLPIILSCTLFSVLTLSCLLHALCWPPVLQIVSKLSPVLLNELDNILGNRPVRKSKHIRI